MSKWIVKFQKTRQKGMHLFYYSELFYGKVWFQLIHTRFDEFWWHLTIYSNIWQVNVTLHRKTNRFEHQGIRIEFIGQIELYYDRGNHHEFLSLAKELARYVFSRIWHHLWKNNSQFLCITLWLIVNKQTGSCRMH